MYKKLFSIILAIHLLCACAMEPGHPEHSHYNPVKRPWALPQNANKKKPLKRFPAPKSGDANQDKKCTIL